MTNSTLLTSPDPIVERITQAQRALTQDRRIGLAQMNAIFRDGRLPDEPLNGPTAGEMIAVDLLPGVTPMVRALLTSRMPWMGKTFDAEGMRGENLFYPGFVPVSRVLFPFYRGGYRREGHDRVSAIPFRTYAGTGLKDPDRKVLKIDYDLAVNPRLSLRRILDELVQVDDNYFFGKAYYRLTQTTSHVVFYFALQRL
jgi:hypothetical protein